MSKKNSGSQGPQDEVRELAKQLFVNECSKISIKSMNRDWVINECFSLAQTFCDFNQEEYLAMLALEKEANAAGDKRQLVTQ